MRISLKLLLISELVLLVAVLVLVVPVWRAMRGQIVDNMQNELKAIASTAALTIDGDLHEQVRDAGDEDSEAFETLRRQLDDVRTANGVDVDHIYTFYRDGDVVRFAIMCHPEPFVGDEYPLQALMRPVFEEGAMEATELYEDEHGEWISAYAPVRNSAGEVVGLLEVDKDSEAYLAKFNYYTRLTIGIGLLALAVSSLLGWLVLQRVIIRPLHAVREGMLALGRQEFTHTVDLSTGDEFEDLADTFNGLSRQLDLAQMIQSSFFPRTMPEFPGYAVAGVSIPCDATGGDYFDAFATHRDELVVLVADVSGHGIGPSLLMATCRAAIRALSVADGAPADVVRELRDVMRADLSGGRFITLIYGVLTPAGVFRYANAGHGPAYAMTNGTPRPLETHRPPVGIDIDMAGEPEESELTLAPGDRILLASDGLSEAMNAAGTYFGNAPLEQALREEPAGAEGVVERLRAELLTHCRGPSRTDDVTIVCVERVATQPKRTA